MLTVKHQELKIESMRKELPFASEDEVEHRKKEISAALELCSLDIKTEKSLLNELRSLSISRAGIEALSLELESGCALRDAHNKISTARQAKIEEIAVLRDEEKALLSKIESLRDGERSNEILKTSSLITSILDEKAAIVSTLKAKRASLQEAVIKYKISVAEHRW